MAKNYYVSGEWNLICDVCSKKIKAHDAKTRWDGLVVCPDDFEHRHPQDYVKAKIDKITVPFTRPRPTDVFLLRQPILDTVTISDLNATQIKMEYNKSLFDVVITADPISLQIIKPISDVVSISDSTSTLLNIIRTTSDSVTSTDSGFVLYSDYIDPTYFSSDYVGTIQTF